MRLAVVRGLAVSFYTLCSLVQEWTGLYMIIVREVRYGKPWGRWDASKRAKRSRRIEYDLRYVRC